MSDLCLMAGDYCMQLQLKGLSSSGEKETMWWPKWMTGIGLPAALRDHRVTFSQALD